MLRVLSHLPNRVLCVLCVIVGLLLSQTGAKALNCTQISQITEVFFRLHYDAQEFDDTYAERTVGNLMKILDPQKIYFTANDAELFGIKYGSILDDQTKQANCTALNDILQTYADRFVQRQGQIHGLIDAAHDFGREEFIETDLDKVDYCLAGEELDERLRKTIKLQLLRLGQTYEKEEVAREKLHKRYQLQMKHLQELTPMEIASFFLNAVSKSLDPHSKFYTPDELEDFRVSTGLELVGIGASLKNEFGLTTVEDIVPGGPADKTRKIEPGDRIIAIAQEGGEPVDIVDMKLKEAVKHIRGPRGATLHLTIERDTNDGTELLVVPVVRDTIKLEDKAAKGYTFDVALDSADEQKGLRVGVIDLPSFYIDFAGRRAGKEDFKSSSRDLKAILKSFEAQSVDGVILDLRFNRGGSLDEAVNIAGLFFQQGPVVQMQNTAGQHVVLEDRDGEVFYDGPLTVLVNRRSASSSEIVAGALQDYERGLVIGDEHTFGKGTVQTVKELSEGTFGAVKATVSKFFRPSGSSTQLQGVESDIVLPSVVGESEIGEEFYDFHLGWNKVGALDYNAFGLVTPYVDTLREASSARLQSDQDFRRITEEIAALNEAMEERSLVSLRFEEDSADADPLEKAAEDADKHDLGVDPVLREAVAITADYVQLVNRRRLSKISFPGTELVPVTVQDEIPIVSTSTASADGTGN